MKGKEKEERKRQRKNERKEDELTFLFLYLRREERMSKTSSTFILSETKNVCFSLGQKSASGYPHSLILNF
jgi:hypothetical protein